MQDDELIGAIARGDETAMRTLYDRHEKAVFAFAMARMGDRAEAADVLHDTMLELWRHAERFGGRSSVRTYLMSIARNKAIDRLRKNGRLDLGDDGDTLIDDGPTPEAALAAAQDKERVQRCLEKLPEKQKAAVTLAFFQDLPYPDVAEIEGVPVGTIKTRIHHAKKALAACLSRG